MKTIQDILKPELTEKKITITLAQLNVALMKIGLGPKIVGQLMVALNVARGLGIVESASGGKGLIIHVWKNPNGSFYLEDQKDNVIGDEFDDAYEALKWAGKQWPKAKIYAYKGK